MCAQMRQGEHMDFALFTNIVDAVYPGLYYSKEDCLYVFKAFFDAYKAWRGEDHPPLKDDQIKKLMVSMQYLDGHSDGYPDIDPFMYPDLIDRYFSTPMQNCDYRINHFFSGRIREMRLKEYLKDGADYE